MKYNMELLRPCLRLAVPLWVERVHREGRSREELTIGAEKAVDAIGMADVLLLRKVTKKHPEFTSTAQTFNNLAEGLACIVLLLGEVNVPLFELSFRVEDIL